MAASPACHPRATELRAIASSTAIAEYPSPGERFVRAQQLIATMAVQARGSATRHLWHDTESMPVRCLTFVVYGETGRDWHLEKVANPTWDRIVASIHRLDRFRYPWVWLFIGDEDEDASVDCLTIMGGDGAYWVGLCAGPYDQLRLFDPSKGQQEVNLWTSDQGFADGACHVTDDVELVLRIAKHFGETGEPLPDARWELQ